LTDRSWSLNITGAMDRKPIVEWGFLAVCLGIGLFACLWYRSPLLDDSYICFRFARNLFRGEGLVYNPGEFVEGYTTLSWVLLLFLSFPPGLNIETYSSTLGIASTLACVWIVWIYSRRRNDTLTPLCWIAVLLVATNAYLAYWSGKGMETPLFVLLVTAGALAAAQRFEGKGNGWSWGGWFGLAAVTRPEAILYAAFAAFCLLLRTFIKKEKWTPALVGTTLAAVPFLVQLLWRIGYYGELLPNTFYAKLDSNAAFYVRGVDYLWRGLQAQPLAAVGIVASTLLCYRLTPAARFLVGFVWLGLGSVVLMGGDHFHGFRMIVPFVPLLYFLLQEVVLALAEGYRGEIGKRGTGLAGIVLLVLIAKGWFCLHHGLLNAYNEALVEDMNDRRIYGEWIAEHSEPGDWIATAASGLLPYVADRPSIDCLGLTDKHIAHLDVELGTGYPGHEKGDGAYILSREPRFILPDHRLAPKAYFSEDFRYMFAGRTGLDFLELPELDQWYELKVDRIGQKFLHVYERRKEKVENPEKRSTLDLERLKSLRPVGWDG
jgi:arabinofuranosyltransferase